MNIQVRNLTLEDYSDLTESTKEAYHNQLGTWTVDEIKELLAIFPQGQL